MRDTILENSTIEICVGSIKEGIAKQTWNDTTYKNFRAPKPKFNSRTISAKENFNKRI